MTNRIGSRCRITREEEALLSGMMVSCKPSQIYHCTRSVELSVFMEQDMKTIQLTKGYVTIVDDEYFDFLSRYKWHANEQKNKGNIVRVSAMTTIKDGDRKRNAYMSRLITTAPKGKEVDHINGDTLDNRKINLRICSHAENSRNRKKPIGNNQYKGVRKNRRKYAAYIQGGKYLGLYDTPEQAAFAYNEAAKDYYGEFACLNVVGGEG